MRNPVGLIGAIASLTLALAAKPWAQAELDDSQKLDSLMGMSRQLVRTLKNDPLHDKAFGVEFNFLRVLLITEQISLSGGVSLFKVDRQAEIALPFFYARSRTEADVPDGYPLADDDFMEFTQDVHYRYFLGNTQNGFYLSGFARGAYLEGIKGSSVFDHWMDSTAAEDVRDTETKLGVGVGLGYRKFSYNGLYWGASLNLGRYFVGEHDKFRNGFLSLDNDSELIFDVEFFKFGWAF